MSEIVWQLEVFGTQTVTFAQGMLKLLPHNEVVPTPTLRTLAPEIAPAVDVEGSEQEVPPCVSFEVESPPSPPHAARIPARAMSELIGEFSLDLLHADTSGYFFRNKSSADNRAHMAGFFDGDVFRLDSESRAATGMARLRFGFLVFLKVAPEKRTQIRLAAAVPGDAENDTAFGKVLANGDSVGGDFVDLVGVLRGDFCCSVQRLAITLDGIRVIAERGKRARVQRGNNQNRRRKKFERLHVNSPHSGR